MQKKLLKNSNDSEILFENDNLLINTVSDKYYSYIKTFYLENILTEKSENKEKNVKTGIFGNCFMKKEDKINVMSPQSNSEKEFFDSEAIIKNKKKTNHLSKFSLNFLKILAKKNIKKAINKNGVYFMSLDKKDLRRISKKNLKRNIYSKMINQLKKVKSFHNDYFTTKGQSDINEASHQENKNINSDGNSQQNRNIKKRINEPESEPLNVKNFTNSFENKVIQKQNCSIKHVLIYKSNEKLSNKPTEEMINKRVVINMNNEKNTDADKNKYNKNKTKFDAEEVYKRTIEAQNMIIKIQKEKQNRQKVILENERKKMEKILQTINTNKSNFIENLKEQKKVDTILKIKQIKKRTEQRKEENKLSSMIIKDLIIGKKKFETEKSIINKIISTNIYKANIQKIKENKLNNNFNSIENQRRLSFYKKTLKAMTVDLKAKRISKESNIKTRVFKLSKIGKNLKKQVEFNKALNDYNIEIKKNYKNNKELYSEKLRFLQNQKICPNDVTMEKQENSFDVSTMKNTIQINCLNPNLQKLILSTLNIQWQLENNQKERNQDLNFSQNIYEEYNIRNTMKNITVRKSIPAVKKSFFLSRKQSKKNNFKQKGSNNPNKNVNNRENNERVILIDEDPNKGSYNNKNLKNQIVKSNKVKLIKMEKENQNIILAKMIKHNPKQLANSTEYIREVEENRDKNYEMNKTENMKEEELFLNPWIY